MLFETAQFSLQGDRDQNQDRCAVIISDDCVLLLLADGMGGHPKGEMAAQIFVDTGKAAFEAVGKPLPEPQAFLDAVLGAAHEHIAAFGATHEPPIDPRATAVAALVQKGYAYWSHAGDSRLYLVRDSKILQRTQDHSFVEQMRSRGMLRPGAQYPRHYRNLVTQSLGGKDLRFAVARGRTTALQTHDILALCTDGLWSQTPDTELQRRLGRGGSLQGTVQRLARLAAQSAAPSSDNVTLLALRWLGGDAPVQPARETRTASHPDDDPLQEAIDVLRSAIADFEPDEN